MRSRAAASLIFSLCLFALAGAQTERRPASSAETDDYSIDNYELTVESQAASSTVLVTMDITYRIRSGRKSTGFKYIGNYEVEELSGTDADGKAIKTSIEHQRETRINWSFAPAGPGTKRIILTFKVPNAVTNGSRDSNRFEAEWAGVFKVPVRQSVYRFVFPDNVHRNVVCTPADYTARERNNRRSIEMTQAPFKNATFEMTFWPRIVDAGSSITSLTGTVRSRSSGGMATGFVIAIAVIVGIALIVIASKAKKTRRRGSIWFSGSSCAGGSSCSSSSSCGSSCGGGGCGGGCGG
jgi:hypothetical protein